MIISSQPSNDLLVFPSSFCEENYLLYKALSNVQRSNPRSFSNFSLFFEKSIQTYLSNWRSSQDLEVSNVTHLSIWRAWRSSQRRPESLLIGNKNIDCAPGILLPWRKKSFMLQVGSPWKRLVLWSAQGFDSKLQNQIKQHFVPLPHPPLFHPPLLKQHSVPLLQHPPLPCKAAPWSPAPGRGFCRGEEQERREPGRLRSPTDPRARAERYL